jgi:hypothetical protein
MPHGSPTNGTSNNVKQWRFDGCTGQTCFLAVPPLKASALTVVSVAVKGELTERIELTELTEPTLLQHLDMLLK